MGIFENSWYRILRNRVPGHRTHGTTCGTRVLDTYKKNVGSGFLIFFLIFEISGTLWSEISKMHENALKNMNFRNFAPEGTKNLENEKIFQKSASYIFFVCV